MESQPYNFTLKEGHSVKEVEIAGETYYEFNDANMAPCYRMFQAMTFYDELESKCSKEYLKAVFTAIKDCINGQSETGKGFVDISKIAVLADNSLERLEWIFEPDAVYKYASVILFDKNENPYDYDLKYNLEVKIAKWKEQNISSFFLSMPVKKLFPLWNLSEEDLVTYLMAEAKLNGKHLQDVLSTVSSINRTKNWYKYLISQKQGD